MKGRNFGRIAMTGLGLVLLSTPAFAQEGGTLNLIDMFESMGPVAIAVAVVLFIMSFWSVGVAIERIVAAGELPEGLFQHIVGSGSRVSQAFFAHGVDKLFFTGSEAAGRRVAAGRRRSAAPPAERRAGQLALGNRPARRRPPRAGRAVRHASE